MQKLMITRNSSEDPSSYLATTAGSDAKSLDFVAEKDEIANTMEIVKSSVDSEHTPQ